MTYILWTVPVLLCKKKSKLWPCVRLDCTGQSRPKCLSQWLELLSAVAVITGLQHDRGALQTVVSRGRNTPGLYKVTTHHTTPHHTTIITDNLRSVLEALLKRGSKVLLTCSNKSVAFEEHKRLRWVRCSLVTSPGDKIHSQIVISGKADWRPEMNRIEWNIFTEHLTTRHRHYINYIEGH